MNAQNESLEEKVREQTEEIRAREREIVVHLVSASQYRDEETGSHILRMGEYARVMAKNLGWEQRRIDNVHLAATMHDIGKIGIPDGILQKPGDLTDDEYETMQEHARIGGKILSGTDVPLLKMAQTVARTHHEKWDGSGYPEGLERGEIPVEGRLTAIIDVYDALVHDRIYRDALPEDKALDIIREGRGNHFSPRITDCFFDVLDDIREIRTNHEKDNHETLQNREAVRS